MANITYTTKGTCSRQIDIILDETGIIENVKFTGGCSGNTQGVAALVVGMHIDEAIKRLEGIQGGNYYGTNETSGVLAPDFGHGHWHAAHERFCDG